jgi:hypothetical protein
MHIQYEVVLHEPEISGAERFGPLERAEELQLMAAH